MKQLALLECINHIAHNKGNEPVFISSEKDAQIWTIITFGEVKTNEFVYSPLEHCINWLSANLAISQP